MREFTITVKNICDGVMPPLSSKIDSRETIRIHIDQNSPDISKIKQRHLQPLIDFIRTFSPKNVTVFFRGAAVAPEFASLLQELGQHEIKSELVANTSSVVKLDRTQSSDIAKSTQDTAKSTQELERLKQEVAMLRSQVATLTSQTDALLAGNQLLKSILTPQQLASLVFPKQVIHSSQPLMFFSSPPIPPSALPGSLQRDLVTLETMGIALPPEQQGLGFDTESTYIP